MPEDDPFWCIVNLQFETTPVDELFGALIDTGLHYRSVLNNLADVTPGHRESTSTLRCIRHG